MAKKDKDETDEKDGKGEADAPPETAPAAAEEPTDLPKKLLSAAKALGLKPAHVLTHRSDESGVTIVTKGGSKLRFPEDTVRPDANTPSKAESLSEPQKDGIPRETGSRNVGPLARQ